MPWHWVYTHLPKSLLIEFIPWSLCNSLLHLLIVFCVKVHFGWYWNSYPCSCFLSIGVDYLSLSFRSQSVCIFVGKVCFLQAAKGWVLFFSPFRLCVSFDCRIEITCLQVCYQKASTWLHHFSRCLAHPSSVRDFPPSPSFVTVPIALWLSV